MDCWVIKHLKKFSRVYNRCISVNLTSPLVVGSFRGDEIIIAFTSVCGRQTYFFLEQHTILLWLVVLYVISVQSKDD